MKPNKHTDKIIEARDAWLGELKNLTFTVLERDGLFNDVCPMSKLYSETERQETLRQIAAKGREIREKVQHLLKVEQGCFGVTALLLGQRISHEAALTLYCAIAARLDSNLARNFRRVQDIVTVVAARDAAAALRCRNLFRSDSPIESLIALSSCAVTLDDRVMVIRESAFNRAMCQSDDRTTIQCEAELVATPRWR
jgi:hypothetical protein